MYQIVTRSDPLMKPDNKALRNKIANDPVVKFTENERAHILDSLRLLELEQEADGLRLLIARRPPG